MTFVSSSLTRRAAPLGGVLLAGLLAACAPTQQAAPPTVTARTAASSVSFYPREAGLAWSYLPEGEAAGSDPYVLRTLGPTLYNTQQVEALELRGRGASTQWYRRFDAAGVTLLGIAKPGVNVMLEPGWQEWPAENAWRLGATWGGETRATVRDDAGAVKAQGTVTYRYLVQERRRVTVPAGSFDVWVVTRQVSDTLGGLFPATQQVWFAPFVGEVRTPEGLLLTGRNYASGEGK